MTTPASENCPIQTCPWCHKPFTGNCCDAGCLLAQRDTLTAEVARLKAEFAYHHQDAIAKQAQFENLSVAYNEQSREVARLRADAARWNYIRLDCSQIGSAIMSGQHYWRFRQPHGLQGPTIDSAMDNAMRERPLLAAALAGKET